MQCPREANAVVYFPNRPNSQFNNRRLKNAKQFKFALCIFHAIVALFCTASAADIYVSADGDDTAAGTADAPVATLTQAYTLLSTDGGTVLLADTVPVTATSGDCYIEPTHSAKITVTSAPMQTAHLTSPASHTSISAARRNGTASASWQTKLSSLRITTLSPWDRG